jgi:hypothetical protein
MHKLHTVAWFIDRLAEGNSIAWAFFIGILAVFGIAFIHDLRANRRKDAAVLKRADSIETESR